jgi:two-component system OmpR family response regulator
MRVLVVEDEHRMAANVCQALIEEGFAVDVAHDGLRGLELAHTYPYDAIVLDLMLPGLDGLTLCRRLRQRRQQMPVLILSARDMVEDRVKGLDAGADDYLVKPFAVEELTARLRALQRRHQRTDTPVLAVGDLTLDPATRTARRAGRVVTLTQKEYALLEYLMRRAGVVLTRRMIAEHVWDFTFDHASNVVDVYVKHLRDKIDDEAQASFIQAVRGVGYVLRDPKAPDA